MYKIIDGSLFVVPAPIWCVLQLLKTVSKNYAHSYNTVYEFYLLDNGSGGRGRGGGGGSGSCGSAFTYYYYIEL
jgi:hypothetical protein